MSDFRGALHALAAGILLLGFATPLRVLWAGEDAPWWTPFVIWGAAVLALGLAGPDNGRPGT